MMPDYPLEATLDFKFTTRSFSTGVPTTLAGTPVVQIYEDNSVTQITAGITLTADFDSVTGLNNLRVVATAANGFGSGQSYAAVISTGTVGGVSVVGEVVAQFSIERTAALRPTTAGNTLDVTVTGAAGIDWGNVENPTTAVDLSGTDIQLVDTVTTYTGNTPQTGDNFARLGAPAGASVSADIAAVKADTAQTITDIAALNDIAATDIVSAGAITTLAGAVVNVDLVDTLTTYTGNTPQTGDNFVRLGAPAGASVSADVAAVKADTAQTITDIAALNDVAATDIVSAGAITTLAGAVVNVDLVDVLTTYTGNTPQTGDNFARLGAPAGASVSADVAAVKADTAEIGTAGAGLTNINLPNQTMDIVGNITGNLSGSVGSVTGAVGSIGAGGITSATFAAGAIDAAAINSDAKTIERNQAFSDLEFLMVLTSDHVTPATGLTVTGQRSIDGGAFGAVAGTIAEVGNGIYQFDALAADTNGSVITYRFSSGTADDTFITITTET